MAIQLRDYQQECILEIAKAYKKGTRRQLVSSATGTGKTILFAALAKKLNTKTLILAHRDELLDQAMDKIIQVWPESKNKIGKVKAELNEYHKQIIVASVQSVTREKRLNELKKQNISLCIIDEAHHAAAESYFRVVKELGFMENAPNKLLVGVTATPYRLDKVALGEIFEEIVFERTIASMIRGGYLADLRGYRIQTTTDISNVAVNHGDFQINALANVVDTKDRNDLIVKSYRKIADGLKSIAFCVNIEHSQHLAEKFNEYGISAKAVWGNMDKDARKNTLKEFKDNKIQVLTNCNILTEGFDEPSVRCLLMARPTKSQSLQIQMVGRGTRKFFNKTECLVIDFTDNAHDICTFGTLVGKEMKQGQTMKEALDEIDQEEKEKKETAWVKSTGKTIQKEFDFFEQSNFRWFEIPGFGWRLPVAPKTYVFLKAVEEEKYFVSLEVDGEEKEKLSDLPLSLGYAQGVAEDYARKYKSFSNKSAPWRQQPASAEQIELMKKFKIEHDGFLTKGQASDLIEAKKGQKEVWKKQEATGKQKWFLRSKGIKLPNELTKGQANRLIFEYKKKEEMANC
jgi:superfamily II DNA or RNA helicase